jgi:hypothetical protein
MIATPSTASPSERSSRQARSNHSRCLAQPELEFLTPLTAIAALALAGCGSRNTCVAPPPPRVVVAQPLQQPVTLYVDLTGNTAPFTTLATIIQVDPIYVYFTMSEPQILALRRRHTKATARNLLSIRRNPNRAKGLQPGQKRTSRHLLIFGSTNDTDTPAWEGGRS